MQNSMQFHIFQKPLYCTNPAVCKFCASSNSERGQLKVSHDQNENKYRVRYFDQVLVLKKNNCVISYEKYKNLLL